MLVAIASDGRKLAYTRDERTIAVHERRVPTEPAALRAWVREHQLVRTQAR
jgi:hypothetical protein